VARFPRLRISPGPAQGFLRLPGAGVNRNQRTLINECVSRSPSPHSAGEGKANGVMARIMNRFR
jgi:hypothetical protein